MGYISPEGLENLLKHKYQTTGYTFVDTHVMNPFWEAFVRLLPIWLAPNLITVIGLICMFLSYAVMVVYDSTFTQQIPLPVLCLSAFLQFLYQTLDACDGKQARKTGSASPLGMLVDHGCDSLACTVMILTMSQAGALYGFNLRLLAAGIWSAFYMATWEEYHTHYCRTQVCNFGVTENQFFVMFLFVLCGILGIHWFDFPLLTIMGVSLTFRQAVLCFMFLLSLLTEAIMITSCLRATSSPLAALYRLLPLAMLLGAHYCFEHYTAIYQHYPALCVILCGLFLAMVVGKIIVASVAKMSFSGFQAEGLSFYLFFLNSAYLSMLYARLGVGDCGLCAALGGRLGRLSPLCPAHCEPVDYVPRDQLLHDQAQDCLVKSFISSSSLLYHFRCGWDFGSAGNDIFCRNFYIGKGRKGKPKTEVLK